MRNRRLSITQKILLSLSLIFSVIIFGPVFGWVFLPEHPLSVLVIDKTTGKNYREHKSVFWMLKHWKIVKPSDNSFYDAKKDYYGFFPDDSVFSGGESLHLTDQNLLYITDVYGVYHHPVDDASYERLIPKIYIPSTLIYGGITKLEAEKIDAYNNRGGMIIAEFNTLESPTSEQSAVKQKLERIFGVHFSGALGRYYDHLQDAALWMKQQYTRQTNKEWDFSSGGIVIIDGRLGPGVVPAITVLDDDDLKYNPLVIMKTTDPFMKNVKGSVPYYYFFEYLDVSPSSVTLANYSIQCTESGAEKMKSANLPVVFPAVVSADSSFRKFYFAGDFADCETQGVFTYAAGIEYPLKVLLDFYLVSDQTRFFWQFYVPLMDAVFDRSIDRSGQTISPNNSTR